MARITHVKKAQQRYATKPVIDSTTGEPKVVAVLRKDGTPKTTKTGRPITRRVTEADKTQPLPNLRCEKCGKEITVGSPYKWVKPKSGPYGGRQRNRCAECPSWSPSELSSSKMATAMAAQEAAHDALDALDPSDYEDADTFVADVKTILEEVAGAAEETASDYQEGLDNMPEGLQDGDVGQQIQEKIEALESWGSELEGWEPGESEPDLEEAETYEAPTDLPCPECGKVGTPQTEDDRPTGTYDCENDECEIEEYDDPDKPDEGEDADTANAEAFTEWAESVLSEARDAVDSLEA